MTDSSLLAGRYRMLERRDHTGTSWRSRDELLHRDVTITEVRLPPPGAHRDWFLGQIRAAAGLRHPDVITLHDVVSAPDRVWLVLESIEGRSLIQTVRADGALDSERAAEVGLRVLDALTAAHERGVHLAATPDTVLLAPGGRIVLTGIAAPVPADELRDLGATLFTALEGRMPDTGSHTAPRMANGMSLAAPSTGSTRSGPLTPLLEELLAPDSVPRPDSTSVRLTLERIAPRPAHRSPDRKPLVIAAATIAVLVLVSAVLWFWPHSAEPAPTAVPITLPTFFGKAPGPCDLLTREQAAELSLEVSPSKEKNRCVWSTSDPEQPKSLRYGLWIDTFHYTSDEEAHRNYTRFLKEENERTKTSAGLPVTTVKPVKALPGIATEAYTLEATNQITYYSGLVFRAANLVMVVQYQRGGIEDSGGRTSKGALTTTRWILESLSRAE